MVGSFANHKYKYDISNLDHFNGIVQVYCCNLDRSIICMARKRLTTEFIVLRFQQHWKPWSTQLARMCLKPNRSKFDHKRIG